MRARQASTALAFVAALAFAGQPAPASARSRGGERSRGGSHAVPRGTPAGRSYTAAPSRSSRGAGASARHPRPGSRFSSHGRSRRYGRGLFGLSGYFRSYGPRYSRGYSRPYRGYSPGWLGYSWWPSLSIGYYYASPYYDYGYDDFPSSVGYVIDESAGAPTPYDEAGDDAGRWVDDTRSHADTGRLLLAITPSDAAVYVDDDYWSDGQDARSITLRSGPHTIEVVRPGFRPVRRSFVLARGQTSELRVDLPRP